MAIISYIKSGTAPPFDHSSPGVPREVLLGEIVGFTPAWVLGVISAPGAVTGLNADASGTPTLDDVGMCLPTAVGLHVLDARDLAPIKMWVCDADILTSPFFANAKDKRMTLRSLCAASPSFFSGTKASLVGRSAKEFGG